MTMTRTPEADTAVFEGLIEGPLPPYPDGEERLRQWVEFARSNSVPFQLSVDGPAFSLLAESEPVRLGKLDDIQSRAKQAIEQLLELFPADLRTRLFSTVQTSEYRQGVRIQSLYALTAGGVQIRERKLPWEPAREPPITRRLPISPAGIAGLGAALVAALVVALLVVDLDELWDGFLARYFPLDSEAVDLESASLEPYITISALRVDESGKLLVATARRGKSYPEDTAAFRTEEARLLEHGTLRQLLLFRKLLVDGNVRVSYLDEDGRVLGREEKSVRSLVDDAQISLEFPVRRYPGTARIVVEY